MPILAQLPSDFWVIVVVVAGAVYLWVLVVLMGSQAKGGWRSFAKRYPAPARPDGNAYSVLSFYFGDVYNRGRGVRIIFTEAGIYFYGTFLSRLARPPFLLPWESVERVEKGHGFRGDYYIMQIKDSAGRFRLDLHRKIRDDLSRYYKLPITYSPEPA